MLRCPRTHGGRESGPGSGVGRRSTEFRCPFRGVPWLKPGGRLVVPLRWRGQTQSVELVLGEDGVLRSDSVFLCGFVPMTGQDWERSGVIDSHDLVRLYWDADQDISPVLLSGVLDGPETRLDSGAQVIRREHC